MLIRRWVAAGAVLALLTACSPSTPTPRTSGSPSPGPSDSDSPSFSPSTSASPSATVELPMDFPVEGDLLSGGAQGVTRKLWEVAGRAPAVKLDVTPTDVVLTVLLPDRNTRAYRWREGRIEQVDSDVQYFKQATFNPTGYPLEDLQRIFDVATLMGANGREQMLQVGEYRDGAIFLTVTTRPESQTVFFRPDGTAIRRLGTTSVSDITDGLEAVSDGVGPVLALGFDDEHGYWADVPVSAGVVERRTRLHNLPLFSARRNQRSDLATFSPALIEPAAITMAVARYRETPSEQCSVEIDNRHRRVQPVIRYDCGGDIHWSDLRGRDLTAQFK